MPLQITPGGYAVSNDFQLSFNSFQEQATPKLTTLSGGRFVATWRDVDSFNEYGVFAQVFDSAGHRIGGEVRVPASAPPLQADPSITTLSSGGFVIAWIEEAPFPTSFDIKAQLFDAAGQKLGSEFVVNSNRDGFQTQPSIAALTGGGFVAIWYQPNDIDTPIRARIFGADGTPIAPEFVVNSAIRANRDTPHVAGLADGRFVVTWQDVDNGPGGDFSTGIKAQIFTAAGAKVGNEVMINDFAAGAQSLAAVTGLPNGGFVEVWRDDGDAFGRPTGRLGIWAQTFDPSGNRVGTSQQLSTSAGLFPAVEYVAGKGILAVWTTAGVNGQTVVGGQFLDLSGNKVGDAFSLGADRGSNKNIPDLTVTSNGEIVIAWQDNLAPGFNDLNVRAQILFPATFGTDAADTFDGTTSRDFYVAQGGDDILFGGGEDDGLEGSAGNDVMLGEAGNDLLSGSAGDDTLNGGPGADSLDGGSGNDVYSVDDLGDVLTEAPGGGTADTVYAINSYTLTAAAQIENFAGATAISTVGLRLTGNQYGQAIAGTYGNDTIQGGGSSVNGGDILIGLRGDDSYVIDASNILIFEAFGDAEGNDTATILATASGFTLNGDSYVETLVAQSGTSQINIIGNFAAQRIVGNSGNNLLSTGGAGADTLDGGNGDDTYRVHGTVQISDTGGNDAIYTSGTFRLFSTAAIELITAAAQAATDAIDITGNDSAQTVIGNYGMNLLDGRGGNDILIGLQGADTFAFTGSLGSIDTIQDFVSGTDRIALASDVFAAVAVGGISANEFVIGTAAANGDQRLIYDQPNGRLYYDDDGSGAGAAVLFAQLGAGTALVVTDFVVVAPTI